MPVLDQPRARSRRVVSLLVAFCLSPLVLAAHPPTAAALLPLRVTSTSTRYVPPNATTAVVGMFVDGLDDSTDVDVTVSTDRGTLALDHTAGLTLGYGNHWTGDASVSFSGTIPDLRAALATVRLTTGDDDGTTARVAVTAWETAPGVVYSPTNGHFYAYVADSGSTWTQARAAAAATSFLGQPGYLASIPSAAVNSLVGGRLEGASNVWFGASSNDTFDALPARTWSWSDGPLAGDPVSSCSNVEGTCDFVDDTGRYHSWADDEPDNCCTSVDGANHPIPHSGEWVSATNWAGTVGGWKDLSDSTGLTSGYVVEYGDQVSGATAFSGLATASSDVLIRTPVPPGKPRQLTVVPGDRALTLWFRQPRLNGGGAIWQYEVSLNGGHWKLGATDGGSVKTIVVGGVRNGKAYTVRLRAVNAVGAGPATAGVRVKLATWFTDPVGAADRKREVAVPKHPSRYSGRVTHTRATYRSRHAIIAYPSTRLVGRQLQSGQGVDLTALFAADSAQLTEAGRAQVEATAASLAHVTAVTCEGYTDYHGRAADQKKLSKKQATVVCATLKTYASNKLTSRKVASYGGTRPVVIGGKAAQRTGNLRVVVVVRK